MNLVKMVGCVGVLIFIISGCGGSGTGGTPDNNTVTPTPTNQTPIANAGEDLTVTIDELVSLSGSASTDANNDTLTYLWAFTSKPVGSTAGLNNTANISPSFTADIAGTYIVSLTVNDGTVDSLADSITVTATIAMTSTGHPYCTRAGLDADGDGWGWENNASCVVKNSAADPDADPNFQGCIIGTVTWDYCQTDIGSWGFENGNACISKSFCPANRTNEQTDMLTDLIDPDANDVTQKVYDYLQSIWGSKMLSGQQDLTWRDSTDQFQRVLDDTGKAPAIMGYDFMQYGATSGSGLQQTEEAIAHWNKGGLVTFAWHWRDPLLANNVAEFYTDRTDFYIPMTLSGLDKTSAAFAAIEADIDLIAIELKKLSDAGTPVLWRPMHEASGGWFWWGRPRTDDVSAAQAFVALWHYMYDRLTNHHQLHNLIWVWNGQHATWYPGDAYADIVSTDIYDGSQNYASQSESYNITAAYPTQKKLVALSENSNIPDPDAMVADQAWWLYFMTWNDVSEEAGVTSNENFWTGEYYNTNSHKQHVYDHESVITLDELPDF
ncbi:MAG: glycosyl hydrolase [Colwellia sp.]